MSLLTKAAVATSCELPPGALGEVNAREDR